MKRHIATTGLLLATLVNAQQATTPAGYLNQEGVGSYVDLFGTYGTGSAINTYYTVIDASNTGPARNVTRLSFRRDGQAAGNPAYVARTVTMTARMAHANFALVANNSINDESTLRTSPWLAVFAAKTVVLPDHTQQPAGVAPFDAHLPLDVPFAYNGQAALFYQVKCSPSNVANGTPYPLDATWETPFSEGAIAYQGQGCQVAGRAQRMLHESHLRNYGPGGTTDWLLTTSYGPASAPAIMVMGRSNPALQVGGCALLLAQPIWVIPAGTTNANGTLNHVISFRHEAQFIGATLYTQALAADATQPGLPLAFANGMRVTYPTNPTPTILAAGTPVWTSAQTFPNTFPLVIGDTLVVGLSW